VSITVAPEKHFRLLEKDRACLARQNRASRQAWMLLPDYYFKEYSYDETPSISSVVDDGVDRTKFNEPGAISSTGYCDEWFGCGFAAAWRER
jgi:hypothetical protein